MSLRDLDVEEIGKSFFRHCTNPKALYVTLIERWWIVALCAIVGTACGVGVIVTSEKQFSAEGKLLVYQKLPTFMDDATRVLDPKAYDSLFATHVQLIGSPLIVDKAVKDFSLGDLEELDEIHAVHRAIGDKPLSDLIRENLKVRRAGSGDSAGAFVISVEFNHKSAKECPEVVSAILETYRTYVNNSMLDDQNKAVDLLSTVKSQIQDEVKQKSQEYRDFLSQAPGVWDRDTLTNSHQKRVEIFETELTRLEIQQKAVSSRIEILKKKTHPVTEKPLTDLERLALIDDYHLPRIEVLVSVQGEKVAEAFQGSYPERQEAASAYYDDLLKRLVEMNAVAANVGKNHPKYIDMMADIKVLKEQISERESQSSKDREPNGLTASELVSAYEVLLVEEARDLEQRIAFVEKRIESEIAASKNLFNFSIHAAQLKDEYDTSRELSAVLLDKVQKQTLLSQFGSYVAEIVQHPRKGQLTWPKKPIILVLFTLSGFFFGSFAALGLDLVQFSPLGNLFGFLPNWLIRKNEYPSGGFPAT